MKRICNIIIEITVEAFSNFVYFIESNLITLARILNFILPYAMYFIGHDIATNRGSFAVGLEFFIPLVFAVFIYYLKSTANKLGKGMTVPVPDKRFTEVDEDGEVRIENKRIQELILYMADLEDWMERKGML